MTVGRPPDNEVGPPAQSQGANKTTGRDVDTSISPTLVNPPDTPAEPVAAELRRRRAAALRSVPLGGGFRDPLDRLAAPPGPSDFGLCRTDLVAEVGRCRKVGWADWELVVRFLDPQRVAA